MTGLQNAGIEDTRRALESAAAQHEAALKALKEKMLKASMLCFYHFACLVFYVHLQVADGTRQLSGGDSN
jgi:hypothetical protein